MLKLSAIALTLISYVFADVYITNPVASSSWTAGQTEKITWKSSDDSILTGTVTISIRSGDPNNLNAGYVLANKIAANGLSASIKIPEDLASGSDYTISIVDSKNKAVYSSFFGLKGNPNLLQATDKTTASTTTVVNRTTIEFIHLNPN
ncbi:hypothetical protein BB561_004660 [Smittium simulii]|uniref:Yeast cell wall synthesis Kre9/Knh1-like N-terminal domain-containing protein n=1 Tax=Smittium simulii TaxID=133385 RepID=A0A2T9YEY0_9FUNG|nr:hypothetical protein BB561_004660 [Smittium simulii]